MLSRMKSVHSFAALALAVVGSACSFPLPSLGKSGPPPKNHVYHFAEARGETLGSVIESSTRFLRGTKAPTKPFSRPRTRLAVRQTQTTTQHASHTLSLQALLLDRTELLNGQSKEAFELAVLNFVAKGMDRLDTPVESISDVTVVDQKLTWSRLVNGQSATGIEVYFTVKAIVSGDVEQQDLESTLQSSLFDDNSRAFHRAFNLALRREPPAGDEEPDSVIETLKPMQVPLGLSAIAAGCIGLVAILFACTRHANRVESDQKEAMSKTSVVELKDASAKEKEAYPVQQATTGRRVAYHDSSDSSSAEDVLTFDDNSFNASLVFCPSVEKAQQDVRAMFDCGESAIANMNDATDSEGGDTLEHSPVPHAQRHPLTSNDLSAFDDDVRRAEC